MRHSAQQPFPGLPNEALAWFFGIGATAQRKWVTS
jgi:hypothetical protein